VSAHGSAQTQGSEVKKAAKEVERWARLADLVLIIAREIQFRGYSDARAVPLTASEGMVMRYLQSHPIAPPNQIASAVGIQRTNLSTLLRGLESKGLLARRTSPDDRRGVMVHLTERGSNNYALVRREWATAASMAAENDTSSLDETLGLLGKIQGGLAKMRPRSAGRNMLKAER
jgi:DNA-binding MarR family transcriptional regulator